MEITFLFIYSKIRREHQGNVLQETGSVLKVRDKLVFFQQLLK